MKEIIVFINGNWCPITVKQENAPQIIETLDAVLNRSEIFEGTKMLRGVDALGRIFAFNPEKIDGYMCDECRKPTTTGS